VSGNGGYRLIPCLVAREKGIPEGPRSLNLESSSRTRSRKDWHGSLNPDDVVCRLKFGLGGALVRIVNELQLALVAFAGSSGAKALAAAGALQVTLDGTMSMMRDRPWSI
jgi:hypothetical protein